MHARGNYDKQKAPLPGCFLGKPFGLLDAGDLDSVRSFRTVSNFKANCVTFAEVVKAYADKLVGVEKEIFCLTIALDEPETLVGKTGDCSCLHSVKRRIVKSRQWAGGEVDPYFSGSALFDIEILSRLHLLSRLSA
jgi:hypothetical protein